MARRPQIAALPRSIEVKMQVNVKPMASASPRMIETAIDKMTATTKKTNAFELEKEWLILISSLKFMLKTRSLRASLILLRNLYNSELRGIRLILSKFYLALGWKGWFWVIVDPADSTFTQIQNSRKIRIESSLFSTQ